MIKKCHVHELLIFFRTKMKIFFFKQERKMKKKLLSSKHCDTAYFHTLSGNKLIKLNIALKINNKHYSNVVGFKFYTLVVYKFIKNVFFF